VRPEGKCKQDSATRGGSPLAATLLGNNVSDSPVWPPAPDRVAAFRQEAIKSVITGNWNPDGTHRSTFYNTAISGVDLGSGVVGDPFVAAASNFTGMLVDLEPYGAFTSQLYFDTMRFGIDGGYRIICKRSSRAIARYINFSRNPANAMIAGIASVIWQTSFAKADGLRVDAFDSPALQCLAEKLKSDDVLGLTVQFNTYRTVYYDNLALTNGSPLTRQAAQKLVANLERGGFQPNPARSSDRSPQDHQAARFTRGNRLVSDPEEIAPPANTTLRRGSGGHHHDRADNASPGDSPRRSV
jgi:hypothetical protein